MIKKTIFIVVLVMLAGATSYGATIYIPNADFEADAAAVVAAGGWTTGGITGWFDGDGCLGSDGFFDSTYSYHGGNSYLQQELALDISMDAILVENNQSITFKFDVMSNTGGDYTMELWGNGGTEMFATSGTMTIADWVKETQKEVTVSWEDAGNSVGKAFSFALKNNGTVYQQAIYTDNWSAEIVPLPAQIVPVWNNDPITGADAIEGVDYVGSISQEASDPDGGLVSYSKIDGPVWLDIALDGTLTGRPYHNDVGDGSYTVQATDDEGDTSEAQLNIAVLDTYSGELGLTDLAGMVAHWLDAGCVDVPACGGADLSGGDNVDLDDFRILANNWLEGEAPSYATTIYIPNSDFEADAVAAAVAPGGYTTYITDWFDGGGCLKPDWAFDTTYSWQDWNNYLQQETALDISMSAILVENNQSVTFKFDVMTNTGDGFTMELWGNGGTEMFATSGFVAIAPWEKETQKEVTVSWEDAGASFGKGFSYALKNNGTVANQQLYTDNWSAEIVSSGVVANSPVPGDGARSIAPDTSLSWTPPNSYTGATYDIYFGTTEPNLLDPAPYGLTQLDNSADRTATTIDPVPAGDLDDGTTYYWVVDTTDPNSGGTPVLYQGSSWSFETETPHDLKIITWNVLYSFGGPDHTENNTDLGIQWLSQEQADVVGLQELNGKTETTLNEMSQQWGHPYSAILKEVGTPIGLTSKEPIEVIERSVTGYHHGHLHCRTYGIDFFVVHFWGGEDFEAEDILDKIEQLKNAGRRVIVIGDFNAHSRKDIEYLAAKGIYPSFNVTDMFESDGFVDLVDKHDPQAKVSFSSPINIPMWYNTIEELEAQQCRIDFIFADEGLAARSVLATVLRSDDLDTISDHYPNMAQFRLDVVANGPVPDDGAIFIDPNTVLSWTAPNSYTGATYDIYFGTTEPNLLLPAPYGLTQLDNSADTTATTIDPVPAGDLADGTTYYWVVDSTEPISGGPPVLYQGSAWSFTTTNESSGLEAYIVTHLTMDDTDISGTTAYDVSALPNYDGTIDGALSGQVGRIGEALSLDGVNDYVSLPAMNLNSNTVTLSAWIKSPTSQNDWPAIVGSRNVSNDFALTIRSTRELRYYWNSLYWDWSSGLIVPADQWSHVALVIEPTKATIYLNGIAATNMAANAPEEFDGSTLIGQDSAGTADFFIGDIDDVAIWRRSLSSDEIDFIYQEGLAGRSFNGGQ